MMDIRLALMCGTDIPVEECQLVVHQPKIKEIALIGEADFLVGLQTFCINKNMLAQDKSLLENVNNFQIFMTIMSQKETADKKKAVQQIFTLFFPQYRVICTPRSLVFSQEGAEGSITIDENNFEYLQDIISSICCLKNGKMSQDSFNPADAKAKEIAEKLMRGRQRVAAQKGEENGSIFVQYLSILTVGLNSMSMEDTTNLTMYQLYDLVERYMLYVNWDIDIRSRMAGASPEGKPNNWMKNIH